MKRHLRFFLTCFITQNYNAARTASQQADSKGKKVKRKQAVLETRKSIGKKRADDSDDDFKPIKAPIKKKVPATKPVPVAPTADDSDVKPPPAVNKAKGKAKVKSSPDSDIEMKPVKKTAAKAVKKSATKPAPKGESDSAVEISAGKTTKRKRFVFSS